MLKQQQQQQQQHDSSETDEDYEEDERRNEDALIAMSRHSTTAAAASAVGSDTDQDDDDDDDEFHVDDEMNDDVGGGGGDLDVDDDEQQHHLHQQQQRFSKSTSTSSSSSSSSSHHHHHHHVSSSSGSSKKQVNVHYITLDTGIYVTKKDAQSLTGLNDPDHPNRTDRYWHLTKKKAFVSLGEQYLDQLRQFNPNIDSSQFRAKRGSGDETKMIKLFSLEYLQYLNDRPRRGFKRKNRTSTKSKTTPSPRGRPPKRSTTVEDSPTSDGSVDI